MNTSGIIHLELVKNIEYLSSCAEDVWYSNEQVAMSIAANLSGEGVFSHLSIQNSLEHAELLINYLEDNYYKFFSVYSNYLSSETYNEPINFREIHEKISDFKSSTGFHNLKELEVGQIVLELSTSKNMASSAKSRVQIRSAM